LLASNNLSDVADTATSRTNLGLGTAATTNSSAYATSAQGTTADGALQRSGGTMTGALVLAADPTVNLQAATKQYVDTVAAAGIHYHEPVYVESPNTAGNLTATYAGGGTNSNIIDIANGSDITFFGYVPAVGDQFLTSTGNGLTYGTPYWIVALVGSAAKISLTFGGSPITGLTNGTPTLPSVINAGIGATLTNAGAQAALTIDGVLMTVGKRVLIYNQTNGYENGVYTVTTVGTVSTNWVLTRATDADTYEPSSPNALGQGDAFFVQAGATGAGETYVVNTTGSIFFGVTSIAFSQISSAPVYSAGTGLNLTGTVFSIDSTVATLTGTQTLTNKTLTSPTINGGTISGITDLAVADGGTGASDAPTARTNLGAEATITGAATTITGSDLTASRAVISNASGKVAVSATTDTELGYVSGVTSAIQTQLGAKQATITGGATTIASADLTASKALISNASGKVAVSAVTDTELGYVSGVTSAIQTQIGTKQATITGAATSITSANLTASKALVSDASGKVAVSSVTDTEIAYVSGVTSAIQTQLNAKQATITGAATTITGSDLTVSRAVVANSSGKIAVSSTTDTEIGYVSGVTSAIQTQLNGKAPLTGTGASGTWGISISGNAATATSATSATSATTATTATTANALNTANNYQVNSLGVGTAASGTAGEIRATNNVTAYYSDDRLKTRLGVIEDPIGKVMALSGFYYEANEVAQAFGYEVKKEVGVSAQEVQAVMPEVVAPAPIDENYLTVRYERLVPLLIEAIKAQQAQIDDLKSKLGL
jgi:hypothetical protein